MCDCTLRNPASNFYKDCCRIGPVTPSPIFLFSLSETLLTMWMTILMLEVPILVPIWQYLGPKLDHFSILNFPSLFSDWLIQKFRKDFFQNFWIDQSERRFKNEQISNSRIWCNLCFPRQYISFFIMKNFCCINLKYFN